MVLRWVQGIGGLLAIAGGVWWATHDTPPNRAANEAVYLQTKSKEMDLKIEQEKTKQMGIAARSTLHVRQEAAPVPQVAGTCLSPYPGQTGFSDPVVLPEGACVTLPPMQHGAYFWVRVPKAPTQMSGVAYVNVSRTTGSVTRDGSPDVVPMKTCTGSSCADFMAEHRSETLFVRQAAGEPLSIKF